MKPKTYTIRNHAGMTLSASSLGGIVTSLRVPFRNGRPQEVLLRYPRAEQHHANGYMNAIVGRVANRISGGGFSLDGTFHALAQNSSHGKRSCSLHGGEKGFDQAIWDVRRYDAALGPALEFTRLSPDGEENYPGDLFVRVVYTLEESNAWRIDYLATTDRPTVVNLTQHAYFNLSGGRHDARGHIVKVNASRYTEVDAALLPTGRVLPVDGTALDLRNETLLAERLALARKDPLLKAVGGGFDHNFVLDRDGPGLEAAAAFADLETGRLMEVWTTEPCLQLYSGNFLSGPDPSADGAPYGRHWGVCFETQHAPDSPNQPSFPSIRLEPGETFRSTTVYRFDDLHFGGCGCGHDGDDGCGCGHGDGCGCGRHGQAEDAGEP